MIYSIDGEYYFNNGGNGAMVNEHYENDNGCIVVGGDYGDVMAYTAYNCDFQLNNASTVALYVVELHTSIENLTGNEVHDMVDDILCFAYRSIQEETFRPTKHSNA